MTTCIQDGPADTGLWALITIAGLHGIAADEPKLRHEFGLVPFDTGTILLAAKSLGFSAKTVRQNAGRLDRAPLPAIARDQQGRYFIVAKFLSEQTQDPHSGNNQQKTILPARVLIQHAGEPPTVLSLADFLAIWSGELIFMTSKASFAGEIAQFDFSWFIPAIVKYRKLLGEILLISLVLQLLGLVTPLFFQVVVDKVLVNHAMETLNVVG